MEELRKECHHMGLKALRHSLRWEDMETKDSFQISAMACHR